MAYRNYVVSVSQYGAKGDGTTDDTTAFNNAIAAAANYGAIRPIVYVPPGTYNVHEVTLTSGVMLVGPEAYRNAVIRYNGAGGAGSALFKISVPNSGGTDVLNTGLFAYLMMQGYNGQTTGHVAESIILWTTTTGLDYGCVLKQISMQYCFGDAFKFTAGQASSIVNFHARGIRFDQIGGYAFAIDATGSGVLAQREVSIDEITMDSRQPNGNFSTATQGDTVWNGTAGWGKGLALLTECGGTTFSFSNGRIEVNGPMVTASSRRALVRINNTQATRPTIVDLNNLVVSPQSADGLILIHDIGSSRSVFRQLGVDCDQRAKVYESTVGIANDIATNGYYSSPVLSPSALGIQGGFIGGRKVEFRSALPDSTINVDYKAGDIIFNSAPADVQPDGWTVLSPATGFSNPVATAQVANATWTTSNGVITLGTASTLRLFPVGMNVVLVGGGAAGVDLNAQVTTINPDIPTITVNVTPSTAKAGNGSIKYQQPVFRALGKSLVESVVTKTIAYTAIVSDDVILADATSAPFTVTLPTAVGITGKAFTIKRINGGANFVTVGTTSSQTIDGSTTYSITAQYNAITVVSDGSNWNIV